jgi:hypothetical protein
LLNLLRPWVQRSLFSDLKTHSLYADSIIQLTRPRLKAQMGKPGSWDSRMESDICLIMLWSFNWCNHQGGVGNLRKDWISLSFWNLRL